MKKLYIITGAAGHLGNTMVRILQKAGVAIRALVLPGEAQPKMEGVCFIEGDVRDAATLRPLFEQTAGSEVIVIHAAGIVDISNHGSPILYDVNVNGTKNIIALCEEYRVKRLVYVSSVHAIPEKDSMEVLCEAERFSPDWVEGAYAKTKAEATQAVLDATVRGLDAVVVHPSGILGPYNGEGNHLVQMIHDYMQGRLPACVRGGYDFVDVRDVAQGCLDAAVRGKTGECYILSNRHYEVSEVLRMARPLCGGRYLPVLPMWMVRLAAPAIEGVAKLHKTRPLYTKYSLYTLRSNDKFCHDKATAAFGYCPRDLCDTVADTVNWLHENCTDLA